MSQVIAFLYDVSLVLLFGLAVFVIFKRPHSITGRYFSLAALSLCIWLAMLYRFDQDLGSAHLTNPGRLNFIAVLWAVTFGFTFIRELIEQPIRHTTWLIVESILLSLMTIGSGWIIAQETIEAGQHVTIAGPLFLLFAALVVLYPAATVAYTIIGLRQSSRRVRGHLCVIG